MSNIFQKRQVKKWVVLRPSNSLEAENPEWLDPKKPSNFKYAITKFPIGREILLSEKFNFLKRGSVVRIHYKNPEDYYLFQVNDSSFESHASLANVDILISQRVAQKIGCGNFQDDEKLLTVRLMSESEVPVLKHVRLYFDNVNLNLEDIQFIKDQLEGTVLNKDEEIIISGTDLRAVINERAGLINSETFIEVLSLSSMFIFFIEISQEVFMLNKKGTKINIQKYVKQFCKIMNELSGSKVYQEIRIVLFCRMFYPQFASLREALANTSYTFNKGRVLQIDKLERIFIDFYDYKDFTLPIQLDKLFENFRKFLFEFCERIKWEKSTASELFKNFCLTKKDLRADEIEGTLAESCNCNLLESINLFLSCREIEKIYENRKICGIKMIIFSCGNGIYNTNNAFIDLFENILNENLIFIYYYSFCNTNNINNLFFRFIPEKSENNLAKDFFQLFGSEIASQVNIPAYGNIQNTSDNKFLNQQKLTSSKKLIDFASQIKFKLYKEIFFYDVERKKFMNLNNNKPHQSNTIRSFSKRFYLRMPSTEVIPDNVQHFSRNVTVVDKDVDLENITSSLLIAPSPTLINKFRMDLKESQYGGVHIIITNASPKIQDYVIQNLMSKGFALNRKGKDNVLEKGTNYYTITKISFNSVRMMGAEYKPSLVDIEQVIEYDYCLFNPLMARNIEKNIKFQLKHSLKVGKVIEKLYTTDVKDNQLLESELAEYLNVNSYLVYLKNIESSDKEELIQSARKVFKAFFESINKKFINLCKDSQQLISVNYGREAGDSEIVCVALDSNQIVEEYDSNQKILVSYKRNFDLALPFEFRLHSLFASPKVMLRLSQLIQAEVNKFNTVIKKHYWYSRVAKDSKRSIVFDNELNIDAETFAHLRDTFCNDLANFFVYEESSDHFIVCDRAVIYFLYVGMKEIIIFYNNDLKNFDSDEVKTPFFLIFQRLNDLGILKNQLKQV